MNVPDPWLLRLVPALIIVGGSLLATVVGVLLRWYLEKMAAEDVHPEQPVSQKLPNQRASDVPTKKPRLARHKLFEHLWNLQWGYDHIITMAVMSVFTVLIGIPAVISAVFTLVVTLSLTQAAQAVVGTVITFGVGLALVLWLVVVPVMNRAASNHFWWTIHDLKLSAEEWTMLSSKIYQTRELAGQGMFKLRLEHNENKVAKVDSGE